MLPSALPKCVDVPVVLSLAARSMRVFETTKNELHDHQGVVERCNMSCRRAAVEFVPAARWPFAGRPDLRSSLRGYSSENTARVRSHQSSTFFPWQAINTVSQINKLRE